jgi:hypothetical protein
MVVVAETAGLVGADLRRTAGAPSGSSLTFGSPGVTEWLSFTPEPAYQGTTAIIVGVVARRPSRRLAEFLRPVANRPDTFGHFHAVVFPYRPVPQRTVAMQGVVMRLFGGIKIRAVLHLLDDDRGAAGAGCSGFLRGLCWAAPVTQVLEPGS